MGRVRCPPHPTSCEERSTISAGLDVRSWRERDPAQAVADTEALG